jgi:hypothetical protein
MKLMSGRIQPIRIPEPVVRTLPPPVTESMAPPVIRGISPPVVNLPDTSIDYPTIDIQTEQQFEADLSQSQEVEQGTEDSTRELPKPVTPTIDVGGVQIPLPPPEVAITAGTSAVVATTVSLAAAVAFTQIKNAAEPLVKQLLKPKKTKAKIKQKKPVLHFVEGEEGSVEVFMYSAKGVKVVDKITQGVETYLRDKIEMDSYYEYDNKLIIDDSLKDKFTKEGVKRFKNHFTPAKVIVKKLSAKFSF